MDVHAVPVRNDADVVGVGHLITGEEAVADLQVFQVPTQSADAVQALEQPRLRAFDQGDAKDFQTKDAIDLCID